MTPDTKLKQESPVFFGKGMTALIIGIVVILIAILAVEMMQAGQGTVVPPAACGEKVIAYQQQPCTAGNVRRTRIHF